MNQLERGEYFGVNHKKTELDHLVITDTLYTHSHVDWHYHSNPYFTYLLEGKLFEANKKHSYWLSPGSLLFHNWQDAHYNIKPDVPTRGFHLEINAQWFEHLEISGFETEGSVSLESPLIKGLMNQIFFDSKVDDPFSSLSIDLSIMALFEIMNKESADAKKPEWVNKLKEIVLDGDAIDFSLDYLSSCLQIHPAHLSRDFYRYFGATLGNYIRQLKLNKALELMKDKSMNMTAISHQCGFYDQSHFIGTFKKVYGTTPKKLRKILVRS